MDYRGIKINPGHVAQFQLKTGLWPNQRVRVGYLGYRGIKTNPGHVASACCKCKQIFEMVLE